MLKKIMSILFIIIGFLITLFFYSKISNSNNKNLNKKESTTTLNVDNYNPYVRTKKDVKLYNINKKEIGIISSNVDISLDDRDKNIDNKYYKLAGEDVYVYNSDIKATEKPTYGNNEYKFYKNYIAYNENVVTNKNYKMYYQDGSYIQIKKSGSYPIIIKKEDKYGIEYNNSLVYINKSDVSKTEVISNTSLPSASAVAVLNYHFTIDANSDEAKECRQTICMSETQVDEEIKYLKENNFYTVSMEDLYLFLTGKIQLPEKSVAITIDDGWYLTRMINILNKYEKLGTLFLIGSLASPNDYKSDYLEIHSHTWDLHTPNVCPGSHHGGGLLCEDENAILEDLKKSRESLNNTEVFCYPFYEYNARAIELLKQSGFKMAFAGGSKKAKPGDDLFAIPRYELSNATTLNRFMTMVN